MSEYERIVAIYDNDPNCRNYDFSVARARVAELETTLNAANKLYESRRELIAELELAQTILDAQRDGHKRAREQVEAAHEECKRFLWDARQRAIDAEAALAERDAMLEIAYENADFDEPLTLDEYKADLREQADARAQYLRARAEEGKP